MTSSAALGVARIAALAGLALSSYVLAVTLGDGPETIAGCGGEDDCAHVLQTQWSLWFGVPVSALGAGLYATLLGPVLPASDPLDGAAGDRRRRHAGRRVVRRPAVRRDRRGVPLLHGDARLRTAGRRRAAEGAGGRGGLLARPGPLVGAVAAGCAILVAGQLASDPPQTHAQQTAEFTPPTEDVGDALPDVPEPDRREAVFFDGKLRLDLDALPVLGARDAPHTVAFVFDFTCPGCRRVSRHLVAAQERYGGAVAVAELVSPMSRECNVHVPRSAKQRTLACDLARLSCAMFLVDRERHREFSDWLTRALTDVPAKVARRRAVKLVGEEKLAAALADPRVNELIDRGGSVFSHLGAGKLPKLLVRGDQVVTGEVRNAEDLFSVLEKELGVVPVDR